MVGTQPARGGDVVADDRFVGVRHQFGFPCEQIVPAGTLEVNELRCGGAQTGIQ